MKRRCQQLLDALAKLWRAEPVFGIFQRADLAKGRLVLLASFAITLAISVSMGIFSYQNLRATRDANRWEKHTYLVIMELDNLLSAAKDAESGQRGFLITGNLKYLAPYHQAIGNVNIHLDALHRLTRDNPDQQQRLGRIEPVLRSKLALLDENIRLRSTRGFEAAREHTMRDLGRQTMDELHGQVGQAVHQEKRLLRERALLERTYSARNFSYLLGANVVGVLLLCILYLFLWREFSRRIHNERDLIANRDLLELQNHELRMAGEERQEMEALIGKFSDLYDFAPVGYFNLDRCGVIRAVNLTGASFLGVGRSQLLGRPLDVFLTAQSRPAFLEFLERVFENQGEKVSGEVVFLQEVFAQVEGVASVARDDCRVAIFDISDLKRSEQERSRLEDQLHQSQKMESVGRLAGGVAHDFNNMLSVILGQANLALMDLPPGAPLYTALDEIRKAAERSADLTRQLLAFARRQPVAPKVLDLNRTIEGMLTMLKRILGENLQLNWQPGDGVWPVRIDPSQVDQILANLCSNARDALGETGTICIATQNREIDAAYSAHSAELVPGDYVRLSVSDNGSGMDRELLAHIFEPFFTTKGAGKGTGLGLATVFGAVKQNNGSINVYSEPGVGTTFSIYLPRHREGQQAPPQGPGEPPAEKGQETVLVVEDEKAVLSMAQQILSRQGYTVLAANSPGEALRLAREHPKEIALLVTDVVMPEMSGRDLAAQLVRDNPKLKLLFMSGYTSDIITHHGVLDEGTHFLQKPFSRGELAAKVREVLDRR
ncbi:CHASE3 domain-containing protein [Geomonas silvestris]|nr:CHASE3 domain-containing protein [Geomonas silvestris]